ncbi:tetratricopeptide repeat protein [Cohnella boryungensis]|uniref:Tetratricopeptide repeat protein n=1 Tax=Cohnella boryungensis TaxID=768479 RepID=A0ABV8SA35_9BACL
MQTLEVNVRLSQSRLWDYQNQYFSRKGVEAWRNGEVPHYVTSHPVMANCYAELVFAFLQDRQRMTAASSLPNEPLYICELGAGSGRFAYHFLTRLSALCQECDLPLQSFRYVLTDFTTSNLEFWRRHPSFERYWSEGLLDMALFDAQQTEEITLLLSGTTLRANSLGSPLVVIANYVLDSLPQDLYYVHKGTLSHCLVTLETAEPVDESEPAQALKKVKARYLRRRCTEPPYPEPELASLLDRYSASTDNGYLLYPAIGLRCLRRLRALSGESGLLLLTADKGSHLIGDLLSANPPELVRHGSVSLSVNYHAFKAICEAEGGIALFPDIGFNHVNVGALFMASDAIRYRETARAYRRLVAEFGPDDFYSVISHAKRSITEMLIEDLLAYLRLSLYDAHQFSHYYPRLMELAEQASPREKTAMLDAVDQVWQLYYPLGEKRDLAFQLGSLLYELESYERAIFYFKQSARLYGGYIGTSYNLALCCHMLDRVDQAEGYLRNLLSLEPDFEPALELLEEYARSRELPEEK